MSGVDPECRRVDVLQTVKMLGGASTFEIAARSGYDVLQVTPVLRDLAAAGKVVREGSAQNTKWRMR